LLPAVGVQLARKRSKVLIVSTDPAHNLSDAFNQKFGREPTLVTGFDNLFCMEIDPTSDALEAPEGLEAALNAGAAGAGAEGGLGLPSGMFSGLMKEFGNSIPGIDELVSFAELMRHVQRLDFDVTVFDTAPTGHTLRLLSLPGMIDKFLEKLLSLRSTLGPLLSTVNAMSGGASGLPSEEAIVTKITDVKTVIEAVQDRIHSPDETTFVCVCIPEFLSLYETERLVQELSKYDIDTHNIVVNQVLFSNVVDEGGGGGGSSSGGAHHHGCRRCQSRSKMQAKYMEQIEDLYGEDFHVVKTPLLTEEVRGAKKLEAFGKFLLAPYRAGQTLPPELISSHDAEE
jgi:arsenite-transporting ATPase